MDNNHDPLEELGEILLGGYVLIGKLLSWLPIPIALPPVDVDEFDAVVAVVAIERARIAIRDLPLDAPTASMLDRLLLEWLTGFELITVASETGPLPYQVDALAYTLGRLSSLAAVVEPRLQFDN
ncbi:hypothetical protein ACIBHX_47105 [Nonomuraea sp. NPDC050536]|uniref:hypothetical protein n=1 Tax=Nonomuraea sp. NPDC050536 TaxID=3364366 RepID=UPI0037C93B0F